jgi:NAD+ synthase
MTAEAPRADPTICTRSGMQISSVRADESTGVVPSLHIDPAVTVLRVGETLRHQVGEVLRRRGVVVGMSGGVDSSVCAALAVRALGPERVLGVFMPECDSDPLSLDLAVRLATTLGMVHVTEDIAPILEACGCYRRRDDAIRRLVPEYTTGWRCKIALPGARLDDDRLNVYHLIVLSPEGETRTVRLPPREYREVVAATNFKQRVRKMLEYFHADRLHYAVVGTPNRLEYDQGFFVKGGDGLADVKPIAHLYKSQVYQLAEFLDVSEEIRTRPSSTDTYSMAQTQEEFYFSLPLRTMDMVLAAKNAELSAATTAKALGYETEQIERVFRDVDRKRATTRYLHARPLLAEEVPQIEGAGGAIQ